MIGPAFAVFTVLTLDRSSVSLHIYSWIGTVELKHMQENLPFSISLRRINRGVGYIAVILPIGLGLMTVFGGLCFRESISHYYFSRPGGDFFVGSLFFIGVLLLFFYDFAHQKVDGYLEHRWYDLWFAKLAGVCALGVAFVPATGAGCLYDGTEVSRVFMKLAVNSDRLEIPNDQTAGTILHDFWAGFSFLEAAETVPLYLQIFHVSLAGVMLAILAYFSFFVFTRDNSVSSGTGANRGRRKVLRNRCYRVLGAAIGLSVAAIAVKTVSTQWLLSVSLSQQMEQWWDDNRLTYFLETLALVSFGLSWLIKGRFISLFEDE